MPYNAALQLIPYKPLRRAVQQLDRWPTNGGQNTLQMVVRSAGDFCGEFVRKGEEDLCAEGLHEGTPGLAGQGRAQRADALRGNDGNALGLAGCRRTETGVPNAFDFCLARNQRSPKRPSEPPPTGVHLEEAQWKEDAKQH